MVADKSNGRNDDDNDKGHTGKSDDDDESRGMLTLEAFIEFCRPIVGALKPAVSVSARGPGGRPFGMKLGSVPLMPVDTLEERLNAEWPGPQPIVIRAAPTTGRGWAAQAEHEIPPTKPKPATDNVLLQMLLDERKELRAEVRELRDALLDAKKQPPPETAKEKVEVLKDYADVVERMRPPTTAAAPAPTKTLVEQLEEADTVAHKLGFERPTKSAAAVAGESVMKHAITTFGESINDFVRMVGAGVKLKMERDEKVVDVKKEGGT